MSQLNRRDFLKGTAWMGAVACAAGCTTPGMGFGAGGSMQGFKCKPLQKVRVGVAGLGGRGTAAMNRIAQIPGCEVTGICDLRADRIASCKQSLASLFDKPSDMPKVTGYCGPEAYKAMCEADDVDVVYVATGWQMHVPIGLYAANCGKHTFIEVPSAFTVDECWEFVETAEKRKVHIMQLENCCYGEAELLCLNLVRQGKFGDLVHGEAAYIHDLRVMNYADDPTLTLPDGSYNAGRGYYEHWRLNWNKDHAGNQYPTHGLGPVCQYMNINRGDCMDYLCSMDSKQCNFEAYAKDFWPKGDWHNELKVKMGDMNTTVIRTKLGRTIMVQHDISSPRPYTRLNMISGTKGIFRGCYFADGKAGEDYDDAFKQGSGVRLAWERERGKHIPGFFDMKETNQIREQYCHPYWKAAGLMAQKVGGHGGMDFLMDLRWAYCLQNGLPMDMDVYDLASWCSICELSERSFLDRKFMNIPDFTRGGWKTAKPLDIVTVDVDKMDVKGSKLKRDRNQLNVG